MMNKDTIVHLIKKNETRIREYGIRRLGLFGSFVCGDETNQSDVDLLYEFEEGKLRFHNFMELADFLEDLFGRKVDLVAENALKPGGITPYILAEVEYILE